jgi:hypothetical protein
MTRTLVSRLKKLEAVKVQAAEKLDLTIVFVAGNGEISSTLRLGAGPNNENI